jgi:hypothetical protein
VGGISPGVDPNMDATSHEGCIRLFKLDKIIQLRPKANKGIVSCYQCWNRKVSLWIPNNTIVRHTTQHLFFRALERVYKVLLPFILIRSAIQFEVVEMMLRRIFRTALANCGETIKSFMENFRGHEQRGQQAMRYLLVRNPWTRIRDVLGDNGLPQPDKETMNIPKPLELAAADLFYGQNIFVAESVDDIARFAGAVEPKLLRYVRHIVFEETVLWRSPEQARYENDLTIEDQILLVLVGKFTGLQQVTFNISWELDGLRYGKIIRQIASSAPGLKRVEIRRPESPGPSPHIGTKMYLLENDLYGTDSINKQLEARRKEVPIRVEEQDGVT